MNTKPLEKFAQTARRQLHEQVRARLEQVLGTDSPELRARARLVTALNQEVAHSSRDAVVERVAYTWFNRFCALRYMDANRYTRLGLVSPAPGHTQPELLQEAKAGHIDNELPVDKARVFDLLSGRIPSPDGQAEAYRLLLIAACNYYHEPMPFLFAKIDDYTELLMPDDLLSQGSVLTAAREVLTEEVCQDVEVIGWLYQFYIAEKKDEVIGSKKKIKAADIPAATQLFTPDWIVRYLVQNSLGRLWLQNRPNSRLREQMEYFIDDATQPSENKKANSYQLTANSSSQDFLKINSPEELTILDPAVGSGHMLTYAFDLLYAIYEEEGYNPPDIPRLILARNLTGLEIDGRAAALAAFALMMKARARDRRFFRRGAEPNIIHLEPIRFSEAELEAEVEALLPLLAGEWQEKPRQMTLLATTQQQLPLTETQGLKALRAALRHDLNLFREADNYGSLLRPQLSADQLRQLAAQLEPTTTTGQLQMFDQSRRKQVIQAVKQAMTLAHQYDVVIANPPYMGSKNQNDKVKKFLRDHFADFKADLFAAFWKRITTQVRSNGFMGLMTPFTWMFLSSYEKMRQQLLDTTTLTSLVRPEYHAFFDSAFVPICAFTIQQRATPNYKGAFIDLQEFYGADQQPLKTLEAIQNPACGYFYRAAAVDFKKVPGSPIAYWVSSAIRDMFLNMPALSAKFEVKAGMATSDNARFLRFWHEVAFSNISFETESTYESQTNAQVWYPYNKGGSYRKWYGNNEYVVNWFRDGIHIKEWVVNNPNDPNTTHWSRRIVNTEYFFRDCITWGDVTSGSPSFRYLPRGFVIGNRGPGIFAKKFEPGLLAYTNSYIAKDILSLLNPTLTLNVGNIATLPYPELDSAPHISALVCDLIEISKEDWNQSENSWHFNNPEVLADHSSSEPLTLGNSYSSLRSHWQQTVTKCVTLENEINRLVANVCNLDDEAFSAENINDITLSCNPHYRYASNRSEEELEALLLADTMREFISYAVGCMFGRYSLDKPGLILANQGETLADYLEAISCQLSAVSFPPDEDNAIPMLDGEWFNDDITERFKRFLRVTFGEAHYEENLAFIEAALGRDIRNYFLREFYDHHLKMYKKRPIYWLFSSPKGSFNVLIYMHRYRPDTVSVILNDYLREFRAKLNARKQQLLGLSASAAASQREKTQALKEIDTLDKTLAEIRAYEDEILYPLATQQVQIDLDDGVLVNYKKFGKALKKVAGLS